MERQLAGADSRIAELSAQLATRDRVSRETSGPAGGHWGLLGLTPCSITTGTCSVPTRARVVPALRHGPLVPAPAADWALRGESCRFLPSFPLVRRLTQISTSANPRSVDLPHLLRGRRLHSLKLNARCKAHLRSLPQFFGRNSAVSLLCGHSFCEPCFKLWEGALVRPQVSASID